MNKIITAGCVALVATAALAMPNKQELAKAKPHVEKATEAELAAYKAGDKTAKNVALAHLILAQKTENQAEKYLFLQGAFKLYARCGEYNLAADTIQIMKRDIKDLPTEVIAEIVGDELRYVSDNKAPRLAAMLKEAKAFGEVMYVAPERDKVEIKAFDVELPMGEKLEFALCPAGEFVMGWPADEVKKVGCHVEAFTEHKVKITRPFLMSKRVITCGQWGAITGNGETADTAKGISDKGDVLRFFEKLTHIMGARIPKGYEVRFPTEAEHEYALKASDATSAFSRFHIEKDVEKNIFSDKNAWGLSDMRTPAWFHLCMQDTVGSQSNDAVRFDGTAIIRLKYESVMVDPIWDMGNDMHITWDCSWWDDGKYVKCHGLKDPNIIFHVVIAPKQDSLNRYPRTNGAFVPPKAAPGAAPSPDANLANAKREMEEKIAVRHDAKAVICQEKIGNYTWSYCVNDGNATIVAEKDGKPICAVSPAPKGHVTIPATIKDAKVTSIGENAFAGCKELTSVIIPDGVTNISASAFFGCNGLKVLTIPASVKSIGGWAFWFTGLESVTIPEGVTAIGRAAFQRCERLKAVSIPSSVTNLEAQAFWCAGLESLTIPASIEGIGHGAFYGCAALTTVTMLGERPKAPDNDAFNDCKNLTEIHVPANAKSWAGMKEWLGKKLVFDAKAE